MEMLAWLTHCLHLGWKEGEKNIVGKECQNVAAGKEREGKKERERKGCTLEGGGKKQREKVANPSPLPGDPVTAERSELRLVHEESDDRHSLAEVKACPVAVMSPTSCTHAEGVGRTPSWEA